MTRDLRPSQAVSHTASRIRPAARPGPAGGWHTAGARVIAGRSRNHVNRPGEGQEREHPEGRLALGTPLAEHAAAIVAKRDGGGAGVPVDPVQAERGVLQRVPVRST